ncbi:MAG: hypothetical protein ACK5SX_03010 [Sandaracinobacter sp.]
MIVIAFILILLLAIWLAVKLGGVRKRDAGDQSADAHERGKLRRQEGGNDDRADVTGREDGFQGGGGRFGGGGASGDWGDDGGDGGDGGAVGGGGGGD